jgi:uncharacterized membrane protein YbjE (DUF340 family)
MLGLLKFLGVFLLIVLFVATGQLITSQLGRGHLWQMFWFGFIIWLWGYIILIRVRQKDKAEEDSRYAKNPFLLQLKEELDKAKVAAISALIAITFFYFSISWFFEDDLLLSTIILILTFVVGIQLQNKIFQKEKKEKDF